MTDTASPTRPVETAYDPHDVPSQKLDGVRTGRVIAFFIDYLIIALLSIPAAVVVLFLGIPTFGLAWAIFPILVPAIAVLYVAMTMGGARQSTLGMRMNGLKIVKLDGGKVDPILAALHHILFLFIQGFGVFLPLLVSLFSSKKRLLQDILLGTYVVRS